MRINFTTLLLHVYSLLLFATPLVMFHKTSELFEFNKLLFVYGIAILVLGLSIARMIVYKRIIIPQTVFNYPLLAFLGALVLSTIFSIDKQTSVFGYYGRFNGGLLSIITYMVLYGGFVANFLVGNKTARLIRRFLKVSMLSSLAVILWGLPGKFGYDLTCFVFGGGLNVDCWTDQFQPTVRMFSTLGQPNWLGAYLAIHLFIGLYFFVVSKTRKFTAIYSSYLFLVFISILFTRSRSALFAVIIGLILGGGYFVYKKKLNREISLPRFKKTILTAIVIVGLLIGKTGVAQIDRFISLPTNDEKTASASPKILNNDISSSADIRRVVWQGGFNVGMANPLFGSGVETFAYSYNFYRPREHNDNSEWNFIYNKAHNEFVNYFATTGLVGLLTYLALISVVFLQLRRTILADNLSKENELLAVSLSLSYVTILVTNFFGFATTTINIFFYLIPAWLWLLTHPESSSDKIVDLSRLPDKQKVSLLAIAIFALFGFAYIASYFFADVHYARAETYQSTQEYDAAQQELYAAYRLRKESVYASALAEVLAQQAFIKTLGSAKQTRISCLDMSNQSADCIVMSQGFMNEALKQSPKNVFYWRTQANNYFLFYQATKEEKYFTKAVSSIQTARSLAPTDPRYPYTLALFHLSRYENIKGPTSNDRLLLETKGLGAINLTIQLKPDYQDGYYMKGLIQSAVGQKEEARKTFQFILDTMGPEDQRVKDELESL